LQRIPDHWLDGLLEKCRSGVYDVMEAYMSDFATEGYSATQLLYQLHERVVFSGDLTDQQKSAIAEKMAVSYSAVIGVPVFICRIFLFRPAGACAFLNVNIGRDLFFMERQSMIVGRHLALLLNFITSMNC
jgi:hypothetical protein